jgi:toxin ParE1/3/4
VRLDFSNAARRDLDEIAAYVAAENPRAAETIYRAIVATAMRIARFPLLGRQGRREGTRELAVPNLAYLIINEVEEHRATIFAILHGARDVAGVLEGRKPEETS